MPLLLLGRSLLLRKIRVVWKYRLESYVVILRLRINKIHDLAILVWTKPVLLVNDRSCGGWPAFPLVPTRMRVPYPLRSKGWV